MHAVCEFRAHIDERVIDDQRNRFGVPDLLDHLGEGKARIDGDDDFAAPENAKIEFDVPMAVRRQHGHAVALLHSKVAEYRCEAGNPIDHLVAGQTRLIADQRFGAAIHRKRPPQSHR